MSDRELNSVLKKSGLKVTPTRLNVLKILKQAEKPVDVSQIINYLNRNKIFADKVTIYRILDTFLSKNLINRFEFQEGKFRYELSSEDHHHFICEECGDIKELQGCVIQELETGLRKNQHLFVKRHSLEFFGLCEACQ